MKNLFKEIPGGKAEKALYAWVVNRCNTRLVISMINDHEDEEEEEEDDDDDECQPDQNHGHDEDDWPILMTPVMYIWLSQNSKV